MKRRTIYLSIITALVVICYSNIFFNQFVWDDEDFIVKNPDIGEVSNIPEYFAHPGYGGLYRPLKNVLAIVTYKIWGLNTFGYHLNGFLLHLFSTILVFYISLRLFKKENAAFFAALIFAVHPIHTERVAGMTASFDLLGIAFYLLSFLMYLKFREAGSRKYFYYSLFAFVIALLSSEEAITLPLVVIGYEMVFNHNKIKNAFSKAAVKETAKKIWAYFAALSFYLITHFAVLGRAARSSEFITGDFYSTMLTMARVIIKYIRMLLFPVNLSLNDTMPFSTSVFDFRVIASLIIIALVVTYAFRQSTKNKAASFAVFWFFITLVPFYNIAPIDSLYAERYLYLPSLSIGIIFSLLFLKIKEYRKWLAIPVIVLLVLLLSAGTINRNSEWKNGEVLWSKTIETSPSYFGGYNNLGIIYLGQGKDIEALNLFMKTIEIKPEYAEAYNNIGIIYKRAGDYNSSIGYYKRAISLKERYGEAYYNLGTLYNELGEFDKAVASLSEAIRVKPTYAKAYNNIGIAFMNKGKIDEAIEKFNKAIELNPGYGEAQKNLEIAFKAKKTG